MRKKGLGFFLVIILITVLLTLFSLNLLPAEIKSGISGSSFRDFKQTITERYLGNNPDAFDILFWDIVLLIIFALIYLEYKIYKIRRSE